MADSPIIAVDLQGSAPQGLLDISFDVQGGTLVTSAGGIHEVMTDALYSNALVTLNGQTLVSSPSEIGAWGTTVIDGHFEGEFGFANTLPGIVATEFFLTGLEAQNADPSTNLLALSGPTYLTLGLLTNAEGPYEYTQLALTSSAIVDPPALSVPEPPIWLIILTALLAYFAARKLLNRPKSLEFTPEQQWRGPGVPEYWTCTDRASHVHRWYWVAWLCAQWQRIWW